LLDAFKQNNTGQPKDNENGRERWEVRRQQTSENQEAKKGWLRNVFLLLPILTIQIVPKGLLAQKQTRRSLGQKIHRPTQV
jgi:hypothetical protein